MEKQVGMKLTAQMLDDILAGGTILGGGGGGDPVKGRKYAKIAVEYTDLRLVPIEAVDEDAVLLTASLVKGSVYDSERSCLYRGDDPQEYGSEAGRDHHQ